MEKTRVSIVSYLNSKPFNYGINKSALSGQLIVSNDIPSEIVTKLELDMADIGLVPVAGLMDLDEYYIIGNYCIGAIGKVKTVVLVSDVPLDKIETVLMDYQSRSSVLLARILAQFYWKKSFNWKNSCAGFHKKQIRDKTAGVVIGDRVFDIENKYRYIYDLSEEWYNFTKLPAVFAVWAANKKLNDDLVAKFNEALALGIKNIKEVVKMQQHDYPKVDIYDYFNHNISFQMDETKREGMSKFLELAKKLEPVELL